MKRWDQLSDQYLDEYRGRGVVSATASRVAREIERWGSWLKRRRPRPRLEAVDSELLLRYLQGRMVFRSKATVCNIVGTLRGLGEFLVREGVWTSNPLRWMRGPKLRARDRVPRRLSRAALESLLTQAVTSRQGYHRHVWFTVILLLYSLGLRRGELTGLDLDDWRSAEGLLQVEGRKTGWERCVPVPPAAQQGLEAYLVQRHNHLERIGRLDQTALFVNRDGERFTGMALSRGVQVLARRCGLAHVTLHQFRHTCASDLLEGGVHLAEVQQWLGHQTITTTVRYLHIADPQRRAAVQLHPINEMLSVGGAA